MGRRYVAYLVNWYSGWKEYTGEPTRFIDAGDWVVVEVNEIGVAESGLRVEQRFAHAFKIEDGKRHRMADVRSRSRRHSKPSVCRQPGGPAHDAASIEYR